MVLVSNMIIGIRCFLLTDAWYDDEGCGEETSLVSIPKQLIFGAVQSMASGAACEEEC